VDVEAMRPAFEILAPALDELSIGVENNHGIARLAACIHRVMNVNAALGIFDNAVRIAVLDVGGQFAPIVGDFIGMITSAEDRLLRTGFVGHSK